jgi:hypothetical protein
MITIGLPTDSRALTDNSRIVKDPEQFFEPFLMLLPRAFTRFLFFAE